MSAIPQPSTLAPAYHHNGALVSSAAFYAIACDPRRSVAVEACAGAGKTWMLVSRMVRALLDSPTPQPQDILAITFTKKAAGEMRERLFDWLNAFAHADPQTLAQELRLRGADPADAPRLAGLYAAVLDSGQSLQIRTFHSWFAGLLRSAPVALLLQLGLPTQYELLEDDQSAVALVWPRFYALLLAQPALKQDFYALVAEYGRYAIDKALHAGLSKRVEFALADAQGVVDSSVQTFQAQFPSFAACQQPEDFLSCDAARQDVLRQAAFALQKHTSAKTFVALGLDLEQALAKGDVPAMLSSLLTLEGTPRKFNDKVPGIEHVRAAQDVALMVQAACVQHAAWNYQQRMARLSRTLIQEFAALKRERGWIDMGDLERAAAHMLSDPVLSGWVQERLDMRVRHLLIDEFQDTNPMQWQALLAWLGSYAGAGAGQAPSVFIVGDPKQSIYRFRRAEPQVFKAAQRFIQQGLQGELLSCEHTRRVPVAVLQAVNQVMHSAQEQGSYADFVTHTTASAVTGSAQRLPAVVSEVQPVMDITGWRDSLQTPRVLPEETRRSLEAQQASAWIASHIAQGHAPRDIMVLARQRATLSVMQDSLRALHIPAQVAEKTTLMDCCEVQDIVALLDVLVSTRHDISLARALKSPLFAWSDQALVHMAVQQRQAPEQSWWDILQNDPAAQDIAMHLKLYQSWLAQWPAHDALHAIYEHAQVLSRFAQAAPSTQRQSVQRNLQALLEATLHIDAARYATPYGLVRALKTGRIQAPASVDDQAVQLLTVHGAKGLEAQTVVLLDTDTPLRRAQNMNTLVVWPGEAAAPEQFIFLASEATPSACARATVAWEHQQREREDLNMLYVALTRAQSNVVISSSTPQRMNNDKSWWQRLAFLPEV